jgi:O-antigen ligase
MYLLTYNAISTDRHVKTALWGVVVSTIIPMIYGYYQFFTKTGSIYMTGKGATRLGSFFFQPNAYGEFICIALCASIMLLLLKVKTKKSLVLLICIIISLLISLLLSMHRGSWIALVIAFLVAYLPFYRKIKLRWYLFPGLLLAISGSGIIIERFVQLQQINPWGHSYNTLAGRVEYWIKILSLVPDNFLIGYGIGTSQLVMNKRFGINNIPHNDYIRLLFEVGAPGLILYIIFLAREWWHNLLGARSLQNWQIYYPMMICSTYWIILATVQNMIFSVSIFPYFLMFLAVGRKLESLKETSLMSTDRLTTTS